MEAWNQVIRNLSDFSEVKHIKKNKEKNERRECYRCHKLGHIAINCRVKLDKNKNLKNVLEIESKELNKNDSTLYIL